MTISFHPLTCPLNQRLWSQKCFSSVISPSKTVFSLVWWVSLCRDASLWGEAFIRAQHHPQAVYQRLNLTLTVAAGCHVRSYVCWKCGLVSLKTFPPSGPCFHCLFQTQFFKQGCTGEEGGKKAFSCASWATFGSEWRPLTLCSSWSDFSSEILVIHHANFQQRVFLVYDSLSIAHSFSCDQTTAAGCP